MKIKDYLDKNLDEDIFNLDAILIQTLKFREMNSRSGPRNTGY